MSDESDKKKKDDAISFGPDFMSDDIPIFSKGGDEEEDWKSKFTEESSAIDDKVNAERAEKRNNRTDESFMRLISILGSQAYIFLGAVENPATGTRTPSPEQARDAIDSLAALTRKCEGNLSEEEDKLLKQVVSELQMIYVEMTRGPGPAPGPGPGAGPAPSGAPAG